MGTTDTPHVALRCACGAIEGHLYRPRIAARAICYCKDCQTYARQLGNPERVLNALGGTDIVATVPRHVHFARGSEHLRCLSLTGHGLLRWYCEHCRLPIGNTPRNPKMSYVGIVRASLPGSAGEIDAAFGPAKIAINTGSATGPVPASAFAASLSLVKILRNLIGARLGDGWRQNPFFQPGSNQPIVPPIVVAP